MDKELSERGSDHRDGGDKKTQAEETASAKALRRNLTREPKGQGG